MKKLTLLLLCLGLVMAFPLSALAQDEELTEFTTEDGFFTVMLPDGWYATTQEGLGLTIGTSEDVITRAMESDSLQEAELQDGEAVMIVLALPADVVTAIQELMSQMPEGSMDDNPFGLFGADATPEDIAQGFADLFFGDNEEMTNLELSEVETMDLSEDVEAGVVAFTSDQAEGWALGYMNEDVTVAALVVTAPGSAEDLQETVAAVLSSIEIDPSYAESMMESMGLGSAQ